MTYFSWRDVLDCKKWYGSVDNMAEEANKVEYKYFLFNDMIYQLHTAKDGGWYYTNTGSFIENIR